MTSWNALHALTDCDESEPADDPAALALAASAAAELAKLVPPRTLLVWEFGDAPEELRALSRHGGDEDYLAIVPPGVARPVWTEYGPFGCCSISEHALPGGGLVLIGAHS
jgi:hypothetical protein